MIWSSGLGQRGVMTLATVRIYHLGKSSNFSVNPTISADSAAHLLIISNESYTYLQCEATHTHSVHPSSFCSYL